MVSKTSQRKAAAAARHAAMYRQGKESYVNSAHELIRANKREWHYFKKGFNHVRKLDIERKYTTSWMKTIIAAATKFFRRFRNE